MSSNYTESMRGGAAAPTGINERASVVTPPEERLKQTGQTTIGGFQQYQSQGKLPSSRTGGGHRGATMRFGNDEIKPNDMKEDAKWRDDRVSQSDVDVDTYRENACRVEK